MATSHDYRGMLGCSLSEDGKICIEHQETDRHILIARKDLDEVINTLIEFRQAMQDGNVDCD